MSVVVKTLKAATRLAGRTVLETPKTAWFDSSATTGVFSYQNDFAALWGLDVPGSKLERIAERLIQRQTALDIIVVWDSVPVANTEPVDTTKYLTPIDWAVGLSLAIERLAVKQARLYEQSRTYPDLRILVMDTASHRCLDAPAVQFVGEFPERGVMSMPWIRLFRPVTTRDREWDTRDLLAIVRSTTDDAEFPTMQGALKKFPVDLDVLKRIWSSFLTKPAEVDDHHALANLLGPILLMADSHQNVTHVRALRSLLDILGVLPSSEGDDSAVLTSSRSWLDLERQEKPKVKLLLLDDQWHQGWGEFVCKAVGVPVTKVENGDGFVKIGNKNGVEVKAASSADSILGVLSSWTARGDAPHRFKLSLDKGSESDEILLLDLRLFSGKSLKEEVDFFRALLAIADQFPASDYPTRLPCPGFTDDELIRMESWAAEARVANSTVLRDDPRYHEALTLLPRIISLVDLSYPVILFSSTGRREILEPLQDRGAVYTAFYKPRLDSGSSIDIEQIRARFIQAIECALKKCNARGFINKVSDVADSVRSAGADTRSQRKHTKNLEVELYLDESGSEFAFRTGRARKGNRLVIGGILACFRSAITAKEFDRFLYKKIAGLRDYIGDEHGKDRLRENAPEIAARVDELAGTEGVDLYVLTLTGDIADAVYSELGDYGELESEGVADNLWREMSACIIEIAIYQLVGMQYSDVQDVKYRVFMPTRHYPARDQKQVQELRKKWGIETISVGKKRYLRYFGFNNAREIVQRVAMQYRHAGFRPRPVLARAFPINNAFGGRTGEDFRVLHLLSDAILSPFGTATKIPLTVGFRGQYNEALHVMLRSCRLMANGLVGDGLAVAFQLEDGALSGIDPSDLLARLCVRLDLASKELSTEEWEVFLSKLPSGSASAGKPLPYVKGRVIGMSEGRPLIKKQHEGPIYKSLPRGCSDRRFVLGDIVRFKPTTDSGTQESYAVEIELVERSPYWDRIYVDQEVDGVVKAHAKQGGYWIQVWEISGHLRSDIPCALGERVKARVLQIDKEKGRLRLQRCNSIENA